MEVLRQHAVTTADVNIFALGIFLLEPLDQRIERERIYCLLGPVRIEQHVPLLLKGDGWSITSPPPPQCLNLSTRKRRFGAVPIFYHLLRPQFNCQARPVCRRLWQCNGAYRTVHVYKGLV